MPLRVSLTQHEHCSHYPRVRTSEKPDGLLPDAEALYYNAMARKMADRMLAFLAKGCLLLTLAYFLAVP